MIRKRMAEMPWRDILVANGCLSVLIGLCLLWVVTTYSLEMHSWVTNSSADQFNNVLRLLVLLYIAYGLTILFGAMMWIAGPLIKAKWSTPKVNEIKPGNLPQAAEVPEGLKSEKE